MGLAQSLLAEEYGWAADIDGPDMGRVLEVDVVVDADSAGKLVEVVVSHTVEDFAFVGADKGLDFVQTQEDLYTNLVDSLDEQAPVAFANCRTDSIEQ